MDDYIIRYDNCINSMLPTGLSKLELNVFMYIMAAFKDASSYEVTISYDALRDIIRYNPKRTNKDFDLVLQNLCSKLQKVTLYASEGDTDGDYCLFPTFIRNWYDRTLTVGINPRAKRLFETRTQYTQFDIREFISLKSKAAKFIFVNLKQFRTTGIWHVYIEDFKKKLGAASYSTNNCIQKLLYPAVNELTEKHVFDDLSIKIEYGTTIGCPVKSIIFTFKPEGKKSSWPVPENTMPEDALSGSGNDDFGEEKQENVPSEEEKSHTERFDETIDSIYCTAAALLGGRLDEDEIGRISDHARECGLSPYMLKRCIYNALGRNNVRNLTGYLITLIRKDSISPKQGMPALSPAPPQPERAGDFFTGFSQKVYDFKALEKEAWG